MASEVVGDDSPAFKSLQAAYNPILHTAIVDGDIPPVVYCDVYFNTFYYKTLSSTTPIAEAGSLSYWRFDISGLAQEYMKSVIPDISYPGAAGSGLEQLFGVPPFMVAPPVPGYGACRASVSFRVSTVDGYGIITPESPAPIQGTVDSEPESGGGWSTDNYLIVNAALQWSEDRTLFEQHLKDYRREGIFSSVGYYVDSHYAVYPLTHMKSGKVYATDYGQLSFIVKRDGFIKPDGSFASAVYIGMAIEIYDAAGVRIHAQPFGPIFIQSETIYNLPVGVKNLIDIFPTAEPFFKDCYYYQVFFGDLDWIGELPEGTNMFVSPRYYLQQADNVQPAAHARVWFRNFLGHLDALNFRVRDETLTVKSTATERAQIPVPFSSLSLNRQTHGMGRNNVRANETNEISEVFPEEDMPLVKEMFASAQAYIEIANPDYLTGSLLPLHVLLPIVVVDGDILSKKYENSYEYQVTIKYSMSNEHKIIRR